MENRVAAGGRDRVWRGAGIFKASAARQRADRAGVGGLDSLVGAFCIAFNVVGHAGGESDGSDFRRFPDAGGAVGAAAAVENVEHAGQAFVWDVPDALGIYAGVGTSGAQGEGMALPRFAIMTAGSIATSLALQRMRLGRFLLGIETPKGRPQRPPVLLNPVTEGGSEMRSPTPLMALQS